MFTKLYHKSNPNVITEIQPHSFSHDYDGLRMDTVSNTDIGNPKKRPFKFAFEMRNYETREIKHDSNMVDWEVHVHTGDGHEHDEKEA